MNYTKILKEGLMWFGAVVLAVGFVVGAVFWWGMEEMGHACSGRWSWEQSK